MELELFNNFQRDIIELGVFDEFQTVQQMIKRLSANKSSLGTLQSNKIRRVNVKRFNPLHHLTERDFRYRYRYSKENMRHLIEMLKDDLEVEPHNGDFLRRREQVPVDKQIMAAVRYWGQTEHCKLTARLHGVSLRTLMKISKRVAEALAAQASRYIRMPCLLVEKEKVTKDFYNLAHMPQVIGVVAHTQVKCNSIQSLHSFGNKKIEKMFVQIVSDANLKIRDIDCRLLTPQENKITNTTIRTAWNFFLQSRIKERFEQNEFRDRILIGDSSLQCTTFLYTPIGNTITRSEQIYNHALKLTYDIVNQCVKLWQQRFGILTTELIASSTTARHIIISLALLHNMAIEWKDPALDDFKMSLFGLNTNQEISTDNPSRTEFIKNNFYNPTINYFS